MSSAAWKIVFCVAMLTLVGTALAVYRASRLLGPTNAEAERRDEDARNSAWRHPQFENVDEAALMFGRLVKAANRRLPEDVAFLAQSVDDERIIPVPPKGPPEPGAKTAEKTPEAHLPDGAYREPPAPKFDTVANVAMSLLAELDALAVDPLLARLMPLRDAAAREDPWSREDLLLMRGVFNTLGHIQFKRLGLDKRMRSPRKRRRGAAGRRGASGGKRSRDRGAEVGSLRVGPRNPVDLAPRNPGGSGSDFAPRAAKVSR
ncbi:MAG: hypothetical protein M5U26_24630 [Planctomycetota bacterium]|nr:hypothetical protein [Planctomycetota bacterium]